MTNPLFLLLLLYCHGNWQGGVGEATVRVHHHASRSSCKPLGSFVSCYDVAGIPVVTESLIDASYRGAPLPITISALGRNFSLRLHIDPLAGEPAALIPELAWSSVISPSVVVSVLGEGGTVSKYAKDDLNVSWYVGVDTFEVAPSSVLASVVNFNGQRLFRAVIYTTSDVYYMEPTVHYPKVGLRIPYAFQLRKTYIVRPRRIHKMQVSASDDPIVCHTGELCKFG